MNYIEKLAASRDIYELRETFYEMLRDTDINDNARPGLFKLVTMANDTIIKQLEAEARELQSA